MSAEQRLREALERQTERETFTRRMQIEHDNAQAVQAIKDAFEQLTDPLNNTGISEVRIEDLRFYQIGTVLEHPDVDEILAACKLNGLLFEAFYCGAHKGFKCRFSAKQGQRTFFIWHSDKDFHI